MQFGFTLKPDHSIERTLALTQQAEAAGFDYGWLFDSHVLWRDPYPLLTLMAQATTRAPPRDLRHEPGDARAVGHRLPARDAQRAVGRPDGPRHRRGDSARRVLGKPPTSMKDLEEAVHVIRALVEGRSIEYEAPMLELRGAPASRCPSGSRATARSRSSSRAASPTARCSRSATPTSIRWFVSQVRDSAVLNGRDPAAVRVMAAAPAHIGDLADGRDRTRWFPALVSNHVVDLVNKYPREDLPEELHDVRPRPRGLRLPPPRRGRQRQRRVRDRRDRRPVLHPRVGRGAPRPAP